MFLFLIRGLATGAFQAAYAYTPEVYPTNVRAIGMGVHVAAARVGAIVTPYVAQVKDNTHIHIIQMCIHMDVRMSAVNLYSASYRTKFCYLFIKAT